MNDGHMVSETMAAFTAFEEMKASSASIGKEVLRVHSMKDIYSKG